MFLIVLQRVVAEALLDLFYFPLWWYSGGIKYAAGKCLSLFRSGNATLAPGLWLRNIFVPMFGQHDWQGRIISFFMRAAQVVGRSIALFIWLIVCLILFWLWLIIPAAVVYSLFRSFLVK